MYREHVIRNLALCAKGRAPFEGLLQKHLHKYVQHGDKIPKAKSEVFYDIFMDISVGRIDWIPDFFCGASEPLLVDELSSLQICCIGTLARVDAVFCDRLKKELASYYSSLSLHRTHSANHLFDTIFGLASIESHFRALTSYEMTKFLSLLGRSGSVAMINIFVDLGIDVNGGGPYYNMLGRAAAVGNVDIVNLLLEAGASSSLAMEFFLFKSDGLPDTLFKSLLEILVENARPASFEYWHDPLLAVISSRRALRSHPMAPEILLNRNIFTKECFGEPSLLRQLDPGWKFAALAHTREIPYYYSYMYQAISRGHPSVVDPLLRNGVCADARISHSFNCNGQLCKPCTWLTFAITCGKASCTDVLIRHGANITALDGSSKSAIHLAKQNAMASHPRALDLRLDVYGCEWIREDIGAEQDAETLVVVERAFNLKFQGTMSIEDFLNSSKEIAPQPPSRRNKFTSMLQRTIKKALSIFLTPSQAERLLNYLESLYRNTRKIWSLPFHEALLMRSIYVLSYAVLFAYEFLAFIKGRKRIPMPSRFFLSALALLVLAFIWGTSSQGGLGWGLFGAAGKEPKMESGD